ncbi:MAG: glycosyltransferase family 4 protein [Bacteroidales bacterium]|nr:glycosyltransferase family 4 protein [Bacteroidales bacterium]
MKKTKILVLTWGPYSHASSRIRAWQYLPLFERAGGYAFTVISRVPERFHWYSPILFPLLKRVFLLFRCFAILFLQYDLVYIQRWFLSSFLIKVLNVKRTPYIFDFDDAIFLNTPQQPYNSYQTDRMILHAARVIVSSPVLAEYCQNLGVTSQIITTPVDSDHIVQKSYNQLDKPFTVGWIGSVYTTPFLEIAIPALQKISQTIKLRILLIGADRKHIFSGLPVEYMEWSIEAENQKLQQMDVGIMPLPDTPWARGKGGYKLYLYMAAGIPVIASPVGINRDIVIHGDSGFLASTQEDWEKYLLLLTQDRSLVETMGQAGRKLVLERYDRRICFELLRRCFNSCLNK